MNWQSDLERKTLFVALLVGLAHLVSGIAVLYQPSALNVTPLASLHDLSQAIGYSGGFAGAFLVGAGLMAIIGSGMRAMPRGLHGALFLPQQALLLLQIWTITWALIEGKYPDGYIPVGGSFFILADQAWAWALASAHSVFLAAFIGGGWVRGTSGAS
jgi:hypothetical protein